MLAVKSYLFFFSPSGRPQDLHSFPTRRSSDLLEVEQDPEEGLVGCRQEKGVSVGGQTGRGAEQLQRLGPSGRPRIQDRKSTRLNSSHSQISYAVFCLKKKTNKSSDI